MSDTVSVVKVPGVITTVTTPEGEIVTTVAGGQRGLQGVAGADGAQGPQGIPGVDGSTDALTLQGQNGAYYKDRDNHTGPSAAKATPVDADNAVLLDSAASNVAKKLSWANIKATLKTYFDTLYQAVLVSGNNIKTINGSSVLGSGDLTVSGGGGAWGSISGTLSSQTDLQAALDAKVNDTGDTMTGDLSMEDSTPATSGAPLVESPKVYFKGQGWKTDTSVSEERVLRAGLFPEATSVGSKSPTFKLQTWANSVWSTIISIGANPANYLNTRFNLRSPFYDQWGGMIEVDFVGSFAFRKVDGNLSALRIKQVGSDGFYDNVFFNPGDRDQPEIRCHFGKQIVLGAGVPTWIDPGQPGKSGGESVLAEIPVHVPDDAYAAGWNGDTSVPTKNAIYDKIESLAIQSKADSAAANNELYFSTDVSKLSYKDPSGVVNRLY